MNRARFGAIRRTYLCALALTLSAFPLFSQVVERGRTYADLVSSHPCNSGNSGRLARVTDAQSSSSIGGGGGSVQVWAVCDGVDTWTLTAIGGTGGLPGANEVTESMLKAVNSPTDEYALTYESTTGDFEWQAAATGDVVGPSSATNNAVVVFNSTTGKLVQNTPVTLNPSTGAIDFPIAASLTMHVTGTDGIVGINSGGTIYATDAEGAVNWQLLRSNSQTMRLGSTRYVAWNSDANLDAGALDVGEGRFAAGVVKVTDGGSSGVRGLQGGGAAVASAAALPLPTGRVFHVTGTTDITSITSTNFQSGVCVTLIFDGVLNFTDGSNLKLASTMATTADDTISLCYDGTSWFETSRSVN